jgi:hypothetical protein
VLQIAFTMRAIARIVPADARAPGNGGIGVAVAAILSVPGLRLLAVGYAASNMMLACLPTWAPAFLLRSHGVALAQIGAFVGPPAVSGGLAGTILSGKLATRLIQRSGSATAGLTVPIVALPLAAPVFALYCSRHRCRRSRWALG